MRRWFVSGRKYRELQAADGELWQELTAELTAARRALDRLEADSTVEDWKRGSYTLAHRIRIHAGELKFQPRADVDGKTYTWVCLDDDAPSLTEPWTSEGAILLPGRGFHQHSVTARQKEQQ
jgi:ribosomal protein L32